MMTLPFTFLYPAVFALALIILPVLWLRRKRNPRISHSGTGMHKGMRSASFIAMLPNILVAAFIASLVAALARPVLPESNTIKTIETRDIVVAVDFSGSMTSVLPGGRPPGATAIQPGDNVDPNQYRALDAAQDATKAFVSKRQGDRVALFIFDDQVYYHWPLTDDLKIILRKSELINRRTGGGTNFEGPTESDPREGPIQAAITHFKEYGQAKTKVIILVTDGEAPISDRRHEELVQQMKDNGVRIYILGIGSSWTGQGGLSSMTEPLRKLVNEMGGKAFGVADAAQLQAAFDEINQLELSRVQFEEKTTYRDIYHLFLLGSLVLLIMFLGSVLVTREVA